MVRGGGIYANNILNGKTGYWSIGINGETEKVLPYNWKNLLDSLEKNKTVDSFGYYLVARDQVYEWKELDALKEKYKEAQQLVLLGAEGMGIKPEDLRNISKLEKEEGTDYSDLLKAVNDAIDAKKAMDAQQKYLDRNGFLREEVDGAYRLNKDRFTKEEQMYDKMVRADLDLLHNPEVGIVTRESYDQYTAKEGYASMKRQFFDDIVGEEKAMPGGAGKGASKPSSLKQRTGGQQQIINPVLNAMTNHIEITKKSIKQIVYNKVAKIAIDGKAGELLQRVELKSFRDDTGRVTFPQEKDPNTIMARLDYKRVPVMVDQTIKNTIDNVLTFQSMNLFEHILVTSSRIFTIGTTGAYAPFSLVNYPADQWNAVLNTRNNYTPLKDPIKMLGQAMKGRGGEMSQYWNEWEIMGGDRMTLFQAQLDSTTNAIAYISKETNGLKRVLKMLDRGVDIASIPSKYSETLSRFTEYAAARKAGKHQLVALEEAGRVTAPFHHIGSWKFGDKASARFWIRSIPFANASLQVLAQSIRTAETSAGRKRLYFVLLAATAAYLASMASVSMYGSKDQKEQYKDLRPSDLSTFLHFPSITGQGLDRVRISQEFTTIGTVLSMAIAQNIMNVHYSVDDYKEALSNWIPRQGNPLQPVEAFLSWFNPLLKTPLELIFNVKSFPRITPIENQSMQAREPRDRYNEATSLLAKALGEKFNISPIKTDYLISQIFGRATGFLTIKPNIYNPISTIHREYLFTLGRRTENFYADSTKLDQKIKSMKLRYEGKEVPDDVRTEYNKLKEKQSQYNQMEAYLKEYRAIDQKDKARLEKARDKLVPLFDKIGVK